MCSGAATYYTIFWHGEEKPEGETFQDWFEQFESVAQFGGWSSHAKLVNLSTRLYKDQSTHSIDLAQLSNKMTITC